MNWHRRLTALLILLALGGCAATGAGSGQRQYAPYSHDDPSDMRGGVEGGGGGNGM